MKVILRENVFNLGNIGDILDVASGYGRNYLLPRKLALLANERNVGQLAHHKRVTQLRLAQARADAMGVRERLDKLRITVLKHSGEEGKLYGSVTTREIADLLSDRGFDLDRRSITVPDAIKTLGEFPVVIKLHHDVTASITIAVEAVIAE